MVVADALLRDVLLPGQNKEGAAGGPFGMRYSVYSPPPGTGKDIVMGLWVRNIDAVKRSMKIGPIFPNWLLPIAISIRPRLLFCLEERIIRWN